MSIYLIGPTGFLGENFARIKKEIITVGRNKPLNKTVKHITIGSEFDFSVLDDEDLEHVIFLIGCSDHELVNNHPTMAYEMNVLPLSRFLFYCRSRKKQPKKIITFTTMLQYNTELMTIPCDEQQAVKPFTNNYVLSKVTAEELSMMYRKDLDIVDIRLSNVYGPTHLRRPDLVPSLIHRILDENRISAWTFEPVRDFVFVDDVVDAVCKLLRTDFSGAVNVGSGIGRSVGDVCQILEKLSNLVAKSEDKPVTGHMKYVHDLKLLHSLIDYSSTPLEQGIETTFKYMKSLPLRPI